MEAHIRQTDYSSAADFLKAALRKIQVALTNNSWELPKDMDRTSVDFKPFEIMVGAMRQRIKIIEIMSILYSVQTKLSPLLASCKEQKLIYEGLKQGSLQLESSIKTAQVEIDQLTKSIAEQEAQLHKQNLENEKLIKELSEKLSIKQIELTGLKSQLVSEEMIHFCEALNFSLIYPNLFLHPPKLLLAALSEHPNPQALLKPSRPELTTEEQEALQVLSSKKLSLDVPILILSFQTEEHHSNTVWCLTDKDSLQEIQTFRTDFPTQDEADLAEKTVVLFNPTTETIAQMKHKHFYVIGPKENLEALEKQVWKQDLECTKEKPQNGILMMRVSPFSLGEKIKTTVNSCVRYGIYTMAALMVLVALLAHIQNQAKNES